MRSGGFKLLVQQGKGEGKGKGKGKFSRGLLRDGVTSRTSLFIT